MARDPKRENEREIQPDPLLKEGRRSTTWIWSIGFVMLAAIVVTFFAVGRSSDRQAATPSDQHTSHFTTGARDTPTHTALTTGSTSTSTKKG